MRSPLAVLTILALLGLAFPSDLPASCRTRGGFPVYQCGDRAWFAAPPEGSGAVRAVFWQIGYGNAAISNGEGGSGTGIAPAGIFSGNDSGLWRVPVIAASSVPGMGEGSGVPPGALCLGPVNWGNAGVDGCSDNRRFTGRRSSQDGMLNPNFDLMKLKREKEFVVTTDRLEDFPMAVLLTEETGRHFAVAAVASSPRSTQEADVRRGHYSLAEVTGAGENPLTGRSNIIPWQEIPALTLRPTGGEAEEGIPGRQMSAYDATWSPVALPHDGSSHPSTAFRMEQEEGVGVADMGPLVAYTLERVSLLEGMLDGGGIPRPELLLWERVTRTRETGGRVELHPDSCVRVVVHLGRTPATDRPSTIPCALGRCGDVGFDLPGPPACLEGPLLAGARKGS